MSSRVVETWSWQPYTFKHCRTISHEIPGTFEPGTHNNVPKMPVVWAKPSNPEPYTLKPGTHNNVPGMLVGKVYDELDDFGQKGEWLLDIAKGKGYATAFIDGDAVSSRSSLAMVRLKSFGGSDAEDLKREARRTSQRFADHCLSAVFDQVLEAYAPSITSFGDTTPALCFGSGGLLFDQQTDYLREFWLEYAGVALSHVFVIPSATPHALSLAIGV
jgi:hypothetical protein